MEIGIQVKSDRGLSLASIIMPLIPLKFCFLVISKVLQSLGTFLTSRIKILQDGEWGVPGVPSSALAWMTAVACVLISPVFIVQFSNISSNQQLNITLSVLFPAAIPVNY